jgi:hypothetical protein
MFNNNVLPAYGLGYYDGRVIGVFNRPENYNDQEKVLYNQGYDKGCADFCDLDSEA